MNGEKIDLEIKEVKVNKKAIANIHNTLIQARHRLSLEEIRLMDTIISFIQPEDEDFKRYKIPVSIFKELYGTRRKDIYDVVKRAVEGLLSKPIKIEGENEEGKRIFEMFNFISYGRYEEGAGSFYIEIDRNFKPYLLQLKEFFTKIPIKYTYILKSRYSIRLYELLKQYESTGFRVDYLPDLKEMLGIEEHEYKDWRNFERIVLKRAVQEINEKTDLEVSYKKKKTGRKITHIEFEIRSKQGYTSQVKDDHLEDIDIQPLEFGPDLWNGTLKILENVFDADIEDIDELKEWTIARYKTDTVPKQMIIDTIIAPNLREERRKLLKILLHYWNAIKEIVKTETNGNYEPKINKSWVDLEK